MAFTYQGLIDQIKQKDAGLMGIHLPMLSMHFIEFAKEAGLQLEDHHTFQSYIKNVSYQEKRDVFEKLGFKVLYMTLSAIKVIHFAEGRLDHAPKDPCIEDAFLANQRNVFILEVECGMQSLYFIVEYQSDEPLAEFTVDREELAREQVRKAEVAALFGRFKNKSRSDS